MLKYKPDDNIKLKEDLNPEHERRLKNTPRIVTIRECCSPSDRHPEEYYWVDGPLVGVCVTDGMIEGPAVVRGDSVLAWDDDEEQAEPHIFLCTIPGAKFPIRVVMKPYENAFIAGQPFHTTAFRHMKPLPPESKPEPEPEPTASAVIAELKIEIARHEGLWLRLLQIPVPQLVNNLIKEALRK